MKNYGTLSKKLPKMLLHGGDYNPDQWLNYPDILAQDPVMMKKAGVNVFPWAFSPGVPWNPKKENSILNGWTRSLTTSGKMTSG